MFRFVKSKVRSTISTLAATRGLALVPKNTPFAGVEFVHQTIRRLDINLLLDVGANCGQTGLEFRRAGYTGRIVSFEPLSSVFLQLKQAAAGDPNWECRQHALGDVDGVFPMQVSGFSPSSSLLAMRDEHVAAWPSSKTVGEEQVRVQKLDGIASEIGIETSRTFLKIDVQGYEGAVLRGAEAVLPKVAAVYAELLFSPLYENQSQYHSIMAMLDAAGFSFAGLYEVDHDSKTGFPLYANGLFVRTKA